MFSLQHSERCFKLFGHKTSLLRNSLFFFFFGGGGFLKSFWVIYGRHFEDAAQPACLKEKKMSFTVLGEKRREDFSFEDVTSTTHLDGNI